jgi:hypothetical protein
VKTRSIPCDSPQPSFRKCCKVSRALDRDDLGPTLHSRSLAFSPDMGAGFARQAHFPGRDPQQKYELLKFLELIPPAGARVRAHQGARTFRPRGAGFRTALPGTMGGIRDASLPVGRDGGLPPAALPAKGWQLHVASAQGQAGICLRFLLSTLSILWRKRTSRRLLDSFTLPWPPPNSQFDMLVSI